MKDTTSGACTIRRGTPGLKCGGMRGGPGRGTEARVDRLPDVYRGLHLRDDAIPWCSLLLSTLGGSRSTNSPLLLSCYFLFSCKYPNQQGPGTEWVQEPAAVCDIGHVKWSPGTLRKTSVVCDSRGNIYLFIIIRIKE